jgi:hypothetical protein
VEKPKAVPKALPKPKVVPKAKPDAGQNVDNVVMSLAGSCDNVVCDESINGVEVALPDDSAVAYVIGAKEKLMQRLRWKNRSFDDADSQLLRQAFNKREKRLNDHVASIEQGRFSVALRWIVPRPRSHGPGPMSWGCSCCFALVHSSQWAASRHAKSMSKKMTIAMLMSTSIPSRWQVECHLMSGLHEVAVKFYYSAESSPLHLIIPSVSRTKFGGHGIPSLRELVDAWFSAIHCHSNRDFAAQQELETYLSLTKDKFVQPDHQMVAKVVNAMAEAGLRRPWRKVVAAAESNAISFDGHQAWDEIMIFASDTQTLTCQRCFVGISEPYKGCKVELTETVKSERSAKAIAKCLEDFTWSKQTSNKKWCYNFGQNLETKESIVNRSRIFNTDRCAEAQRSACIIANDFCKGGAKSVTADTAHQFQSYASRACEHDPLLKQIDNVIFKNRFAPGKALRTSFAEREKLKAYQLDVLAKKPASCILTTPEVGFGDAPHRWGSAASKWSSLSLTYISFQYKCADDSVNMRLKLEQRSANADVVREGCDNEAASMIGLHADFMGLCNCQTEKLQFDVTDASILWRLMNDHCEKAIMMFIKEGILSSKQKNSHFQLAIAQLKGESFTFANDKGEVAHLGYQPEPSKIPGFAARALKRYKGIVSLHVKLIQAFWRSEVPEKWLRSFDLELWRRVYRNADAARRARQLKGLHDDFDKFVAHQGLDSCQGRFASFRDAAMERYLHGHDATKSMKLKEQLMYSLDTWRRTSFAEANNGDGLNAKVLSRVVIWQANSTGNERDINKLKAMAKSGKSIESMQDTMALLRYGPKHVSELVHRRLGSCGEVELFPTEFSERTLEFWPSAHGRRHRVNSAPRKDCKDPDCTRPAKELGNADTSTQTKGSLHRRQRKTIKDMTMSDTDATSVFGTQIGNSGTVDDAALNKRGNEILNKYKGWVRPRVQRSLLPAEQRFGESAQQKRARANKSTALATFRRQVKCDAKTSVAEDVTCFLTPSCGIQACDVAAPFRVVVTQPTAALLVVKDLSITQALKSSRKIGKPLDNQVFTAILLGQRMATPTYVAKVGTWMNNRGVGNAGIAHAHELPPSMKFTSCCSSTIVHLLLDGIWLSDFQKMLQCVRKAVDLANSKWTLYLFDQRPLWESRKKKHDDTPVEKDKKKQQRQEFHEIKDAISMHNLVRQHTVVCKLRSTYGKFVPTLRR